MAKPISGLEHFQGKNERFSKVGQELRKSDGWQVLSAAQKWILVDMISAYESAINYGARNIGNCGFTYTFAACTEPCCRSTFHLAKQAIERCRFFVAPFGLQGDHASRRYLPGDWRGWRMSAGQRAVLKARESRKAADEKRRKREFVDRMARRGN